MYVMPCILLKPVSKYFELDPRSLHFMLQCSTFWLEKIFKPFITWEWAQDAISCSVYNLSFWNFHNLKVIERSAHCRHKIIAPSNIRRDLPLLQLLELVVFVLFFTFDTSLSFQLPPPHLLVSFIAWPKNTFPMIYNMWSKGSLFSF